MHEGTDYCETRGHLRFDHSEGLKTFDIELLPGARPRTSFLVFLEPEPGQPTIDGEAYVSRRRGVCRVDIVPDDNVLKVWFTIFAF
jgi:hypothetical protein